MDFNIDHVTNSTIGDVHTGLISGLIDLFKTPIRGVVNLIFKNGIDVEKLLKEFKITFIEFDKTYLQPEDGYFIFCVTMKFNLDNLEQANLMTDSITNLAPPELMQHMTN